MGRVMVERSRDFYFVAYALSRLTEPSGKPPSVLLVSKWYEAYDLFYDLIGEDREQASYRNSLKNNRDAFDAHIPGGVRVGWRDASGDPPALRRGKLAETVNEWSGRPDAEVAERLTWFLKQGDPVDVEGTVFTEGGRRAVVSRRIERDSAARREAIKRHGVQCQGCEFDFGAFYGPLGEGFIEVHHLQPLAERGKSETDPATELAVLCSNCHRMVHRDRSYCLSLNELRAAITQAKQGPRAYADEGGGSDTQPIKSGTAEGAGTS